MVALGSIGLITLFLAGTGRTPLVPDDSGDQVIPVLPLVLWLMLGIGIWCLTGIFKTRYHFLIDTESGMQKIYFGKVDNLQIRQFMRKVCGDFGYEIDISVLEKDGKT